MSGAAQRSRITSRFKTEGQDLGIILLMVNLNQALRDLRDSTEVVIDVKPAIGGTERNTTNFGT
jgi:hypothetical protein